MPRYLLLAYDDPADFAGATEAQLSALIGEYIAWTEQLAASGRLLASEKLQDGRVHRVTRRRGRLQVHDGPYAEAKEVLGGYWLIQAGDDAEARQLAADCPHAKYGTVELRVIEELP